MRSRCARTSAAIWIGGTVDPTSCSSTTTAPRWSGTSSSIACWPRVPATTASTPAPRPMHAHPARRFWLRRTFVQGQAVDGRRRRRSSVTTRTSSGPSRPQRQGALLLSDAAGLLPDNDNNDVNDYQPGQRAVAGAPAAVAGGAAIDGPDSVDTPSPGRRIRRCWWRAKPCSFQARPA